MTTRTLAERRAHAEHLLSTRPDAWVATADAGGAVPRLVPLCFLWHDDEVWVSTPVTTPAGRNLSTVGTVRLAVGDTRDLVMIDGRATRLDHGDVPAELWELFRNATEFDPREEGEAYAMFRISPTHISTWPEAYNTKQRHIFRNGAWASEDASQARE